MSIIQTFVNKCLSVAYLGENWNNKLIQSIIEAGRTISYVETTNPTQADKFHIAIKESDNKTFMHEFEKIVRFAIAKLNLKRVKIAFDTTDQRKIAEIIVREAKLQLTAEYQKKLRDQKIKQIVNLIHRNAVDPKTNIPHPVLRIENALKEARVRIDDHKTAEEQINNIISQLKSILPIKYEISLIEVKIPAAYAAKSFSTLKRYGKIQKEDWKDDGSLVVKIELPAGLQQELFDHMNNITHGSIETKILK